MLGLRHDRLVLTMRANLDVLDQAFHGSGPIDVENDIFRVHNPLDITDVTLTCVLLAALDSPANGPGRCCSWRQTSDRLA